MNDLRHMPHSAAQNKAFSGRALQGGSPAPGTPGESVSPECPDIFHPRPGPSQGKDPFLASFAPKGKPPNRSRPSLPALLLLFLLVTLLPFSSYGDPKKGNVYVIPVSGTVEPGMAVFIKMSLDETPDDPDAVFVLEMDTFGGRVDSALAIVDTLLNSKKKRIIAYVSSKAISAGALIALACHELVMKNNTTIGDCAPMIYSQEGPKMMGEKFQSPLRAKFRTLARRNGYPEKLAEAMVTGDMVVYRVETREKTVYLDGFEYEDLTPAEKDAIISKKTVVAKGELLTMDDTEAFETGFSKASVSDLGDMLAKLGLSDRDVVRKEETWSQSLVRLIIRATPILMMIGLAALFVELKSPGFGVPGITGIFCLSLVFLAQHMAGLANYSEMILIFLGVILMGIELFILPGFGVCGFLGLLCIFSGMILCLQDFTLPDPSFPWQKELMVKNITVVVGSLISSLFISILFIRHVIPRTIKIIRGPYLDHTLEDSHADSSETITARLGSTGTALTPLRPSGKALISDQVFDVITPGEFIEKDASIVITEISGNRIIVSRKPEE